MFCNRILSSVSSFVPTSEEVTNDCKVKNEIPSYFVILDRATYRWPCVKAWCVVSKRICSYCCPWDLLILTAYAKRNGNWVLVISYDCPYGRVNRNRILGRKWTSPGELLASIVCTLIENWRSSSIRTLWLVASLVFLPNDTKLQNMWWSFITIESVQHLTW